MRDTQRRMTWDEYFLQILDVISSRATCNRGRSACILVGKNRNILSTGYVGSLRGLPHCDDEGHDIVKYNNEEHCIRTVHAEANAVAQAARHGIELDGATAYITMEPCTYCLKLLAQSGISRIVCKYKYRFNKSTLRLLEGLNIQYEVMIDEIHKYEED